MPSGFAVSFPVSGASISPRGTQIPGGPPKTQKLPALGLMVSSAWPAATLAGHVTSKSDCPTEILDLLLCSSTSTLVTCQTHIGGSTGKC